MTVIKEQPTNLPSTNDLDRLPLQTAVIEAAWVRFTGSSTGALEDAPELDEERTYIVRAKCAERKHKRNKDHEERLTAVMEIEWVREQGKAPAPSDPNQTSLLNVDGTARDDTPPAGDE